MEHYQRPRMVHAVRKRPYDPVIRSGRDLTLCLITLGAVVQSTWLLDGIVRALTYLFK
jgi:hypothetical protein